MAAGIHSDDELAAWLRLSTAPQLGAVALRRLLAAFGSPEAVLFAPAAARRAVAGEAAVTAFAVTATAAAELWDRTARWLSDAPPGVPRELIPLGDPRYPQLLLQAADPPLLLHAEGHVPLLAAVSLGVVGSRSATPQGLAHARGFSEQLAGAGVTVVSGLAAGVDGAAHAGALPHPASTIAVVGTGLDRVYPARHADLAERIRHRGLLVSEHPLGTPPLAHHFPRRNRLIAGLTRGTLVVEAALASGSLITARLASEAGREVFAIPGSILSTQSQGCHALLKQGAKLVETLGDILEELGDLGIPPARPTTPPLSGAPPAAGEGTADPVLVALAHDPVDLDTLVERTGSTAPHLTARLLELEFEGRVARLPGQRFQRLGSL